MKPETILRRAAERKVRVAEQTARLRARLEAKALEEGPGSIWAEMLRESNKITQSNPCDPLQKD